MKTYTWLEHQEQALHSMVYTDIWVRPNGKARLQTHSPDLNHTEMTLGYAGNTEFRLHRKLWLALKHSQRTKKSPKPHTYTKTSLFRQQLLMNMLAESLGQPVQHMAAAELKTHLCLVRTKILLPISKISD